MHFDWDPAKAKANRRKHGVSFEEARALFTSAVEYLEVYDASHSDDEDRFFAIGPTVRGLLCVVFVERGEDRIRILGARRATRRERGLYERYLRGDTR
ncbi:MAG TPA: BrnT family toxin [Planctomycetota bacterium]|nr:BrnT family toxin [Planctomycetota bacterium]